MNILIANPGSTSYKCKVIDMKDGAVLFSAAIDRIGEKESRFVYSGAKDKTEEKAEVPDTYTAVQLTLEKMKQICPSAGIRAVGFKTVLAKGVSGCVELDVEVIAAMKAFEPLAPVHTRVYLSAIEVFQKLMPETPLVGLFETAFHRDMPPESFLYGIPYEWFEKHGVRKYGFHGASHRYIATRVKERYARGSFRLISCHLGGSSSVCAIRDGISVDTSMGMSPQSGLLNAKRVGDLDPFALLYLLDAEHLSTDRMREILISRSGVAGISGTGGDFRDIEKAMSAGNKRARLAFDAFAYSVKRYIGEYLAILNSSDFIVFTGGLGQNSPSMRSKVLENMENLGILLDGELNASNPEEGPVSCPSSRVQILVIPTDEERIVAQEVAMLLEDRTA